MSGIPILTLSMKRVEDVRRTDSLRRKVIETVPMKSFHLIAHILCVFLIVSMSIDFVFEFWGVPYLIKSHREP